MTLGHAKNVVGTCKLSSHAFYLQNSPEIVYFERDTAGFPQNGQEMSHFLENGV